ncbi:MAG: LPS-assembly protein LptD [Proteobacteria bacterium]|nr:LPS-assembly protein LptD [Pseudomonadota bacterium]
MSKIKQITILLLFSIIVLFPLFSYAVDGAPESADSELPVEIDADSINFDQETNIYVAEGNVVARQAGITLMADKMVIDMTKGSLTATGNLSGLDEGGNELSGDSLELDLDLKGAILVNGTLFFQKNNVYIRSSEIRKVGPQSYEAGYTTYTSCDCDDESGERPAWSISTRSSTVTIGEYFTGWHSVFRVKSLPLFYFPYVKVPVKMERQSGFLLPTPGYSDVRGATLGNYFYWNIASTTDATFTYDHDTERGRGVGLEFRHYSTRRSYSELNLYYYREDDIDRVRGFRDEIDNLSRPLSADADRWELKFTHDQTLPLSFVLRADVNIVSDDEYLIDFEEDKDRRAVASLESTVSLTRKWDLYSFVLEFRRFDNLLSKKDEDVLQKIPELTFTALPRKIYNSPFYVALTSSAVNYIRTTGVDGQRVDIAPKLSMPLRPGKYFEITPSFAPRYTRYRTVEDAGTFYSDRLFFEFRTDAVSTIIKNFGESETDHGVIRHTIRPRISYVYIPNVDQEGNPSFDYIDDIDATNKLEYSINSTLSRRHEEGGAHRRYEYIYFNLAHEYDFEEAQRSLVDASDEREPFGDIEGELRLNPVKYVSFVIDGDYNLYEGLFDRYDATLNFSDNRGDNFYIAYRNDRDLGSLYMEAGATLRVHSKLDLKLKQRYSFDEERSLESRVDVKFKQQCWGAILTYQKTPEEETLLLNFTLESIGELIGLSESI